MRQSLKSSLQPLLAVCFAAACSVPEFGFSEGSGGADASTGGGGTTASGGSSGSSGGGGSGGVAGTAGTAGTGGAPAQCVDNSACSGATPFCDKTTGKCVQCLQNDDQCPSGQYCAPTRVCNAGCKGDPDCKPDGGGALSCDPVSRKCLGCVLDDDCASGTICDTKSTACVAGCTAQHPCAPGFDCCSGSCVLLALDVNHCGKCDASCPKDPPNATPACTGGKCTLNCTFLRADCNKDPADGCEVDVATDSSNCGQCGLSCPAGTSCSNKLCT